LEPVDLREARPHLVDQFVLRYQQKASAKAFRETVCQIPLVLDASRDLPFDGIQRMRPDV
jgi:hypothetical protein